LGFANNLLFWAGSKVS